jgi:hypothetical protein
MDTGGPPAPAGPKCPQYPAMVDPLHIDQILMPAEKAASRLPIHLDDNCILGGAYDIDKLQITLTLQLLDRMGGKRSKDLAQFEMEYFVAISIAEHRLPVLDPRMPQASLNRLISQTLAAKASNRDAERQFL